MGQFKGNESLGIQLLITHILPCRLYVQHIKHPWAPLFRLQLKRPEGVGELSLCRVHIAYGYPDATGTTHRAT